MIWDNPNLINKKMLDAAILDNNYTNYYGSNLKPDLLWSKFVENIDVSNPINKKAIIIKDTNVRGIPSTLPLYKTAEDYPVDRLQATVLPANKIVNVLYLSKDKAWAGITSSHGYFGWVSILDIAYVSEKMAQDMRKLPMAVVTQDRMPMYDLKKHFLAYSRMGAPCFYKNGYALWPTKNAHGNLKWQKIKMQYMTTKPLTIDQAKTVTESMIDLPYGWGDAYGFRDCSGLLQDYMALLGVFCYKNSRAQAGKSQFLETKTPGQYYDLQPLSVSEKQKYILEKGVPYRTILSRPGHVVLYTGEKEGQIMVWQAALNENYKLPYNDKKIGKINHVAIGKLIEDLDVMVVH